MSEPSLERICADVTKRLRLQAKFESADRVLTVVARRELHANIQLAICVTVTQWDLEKDEAPPLVLGHGQGLYYRFDERGEKSFGIAPAPKKQAMMQKPGYSFFVEIDVRLTSHLCDIGGAEFRALPGTHWQQDEFFVVDTYVPSGRAGWRVKLHFEEPSPTTTVAKRSSKEANGGRLLTSVSVTHDPAEHTEYIGRLLQNALEPQRRALMPLLAAQITGARAPRHSLSAAHQVAASAHLAAVDALVDSEAVDDDSDSSIENGDDGTVHERIAKRARLDAIAVMNDVFE